MPKQFPDRLIPLARSANVAPFYGDLHNHCGISYGHGSLENALRNATLPLDFVSITGHAYWPDMPAFCIFFGPTPVSRGTTPTAAGPVNIFGKLNETDIPLLRSISSGEKVRVEALP